MTAEDSSMPTDSSSQGPVGWAGRKRRPGPNAKTRNRLITWGIVVVAVIVAYSAATWYTSRPAFCNACHEMSPYYTAWQQGPHADESCIGCHVDPGIVAQFMHKFVALREVWVHYTGKPQFPMASLEPIPDRRCLGCHDEPIDPGIANFNHDEHRANRSCTTCHDKAGHTVTADALQAAGILNADVQAQKLARGTIATGVGVALAGHKNVGCSTCHDMPATTCAACHEPPAKHYQRPCTTCHAPGEQWGFAHPDAASACSLCHDRPANHRDGECSACHAPGESWEFSHTADANCVSCHTPPSNHYAGSCSACHTPSKPFSQTTFTHPGSGATCTDCHSAPAGHAAGQCSQCHAPGKTWAFSHPRINGEHNYKSFACTKCHPGGGATVNCTCHGGGTPQDND